MYISAYKKEDSKAILANIKREREYERKAGPFTDVTFEEDDVYDQHDAEGFIKLNALRLKLLKRQR